MTIKVAVAVVVEVEKHTDQRVSHRQARTRAWGIRNVWVDNFSKMGKSCDAIEVVLKPLVTVPAMLRTGVMHASFHCS